MAALVGHEPAAAYSGLVDDLVDEALTRAGRRLPDPEGPS
jgi:hypothetical protein